MSTHGAQEKCMKSKLMTETVRKINRIDTLNSVEYFQNLLCVVNSMHPTGAAERNERHI